MTSLWLKFVKKQQQWNIEINCMHLKKFCTDNWSLYLQKHSIAGQRLQIPTDSCGEQNPQTGTLLQDQESSTSQLEIVSFLVYIWWNLNISYKKQYFFLSKTVLDSRCN